MAIEEAKEIKAAFDAKISELTSSRAKIDVEKGTGDIEVWIPIEKA